MNEEAARISQRSEALGGDGGLALYYMPTGGAGRPWKAVTTIAGPRRRGRYLEVRGKDPFDALYRLFRVMPAVPDR